MNGASWRVSVSVSARELRARRQSRQGVYLYICHLLTLLYTETISNYDVVQPVIFHRDSIEVSKGW